MHFHILIQNISSDRPSEPWVRSWGPWKHKKEPSSRKRYSFPSLYTSRFTFLHKLLIDFLRFCFVKVNAYWKKIFPLARHYLNLTQRVFSAYGKIWVTSALNFTTRPWAPKLTLQNNENVQISPVKSKFFRTHFRIVIICLISYLKMLKCIDT